jgi:hypothetical protein
MNIEETKESIRIMQAFVDGKEVEALSPNKKWGRTPAPRWGWDDTEYRIKPTATLRPWTADEIPLGVQVRKKSDPTSRWLIGNTGSHDDRLKYVETHEHSTDNGKTWLPCGVMEESK